MHKNIKLLLQYPCIQVRSTVDTNQIKTIILLQYTCSVQEMESLPMRNASYTVSQKTGHHTFVHIFTNY